MGRAFVSAVRRWAPPLHRVKTMALKQVSSNKCFEGFQKVFEHDSAELKCKMKFGIYLPPKAETKKCPVLYWLSGLTCTEQNFITKSGFHQAAAEHGLIVVAPDTSPPCQIHVSRGFQYLEKQTRNSSPLQLQQTADEWLFKIMCCYLYMAELMCNMGNLKMVDLQLLEIQSFGDPVCYI